jgi:hypothetical protein
MPETLEPSNKVKPVRHWFISWQSSSIFGDVRSPGHLHSEEASIVKSEHLPKKIAFLLYQFRILSLKYLCDSFIYTGSLTMPKHIFYFGFVLKYFEPSLAGFKF